MQMYGRKKRTPLWLSPAMILLYITFILVFGIYFGVAFLYFGNHYLPNTVVGNVECGMKTPAYVVDQNEAQADRYSILINDRKGSSFYIEGQDFNYRYINKGEELAILEDQNPLLWPFCFNETLTYNLGYSVDYDQEKLDKLVSNLGLFKEEYMEAPQDAYIEVTEDGYQIVSENMGNTAITEVVVQEVSKAVANLETDITLSSACYVPPEIYTSSEIIISTATNIDTYLKAEITYDCYGFTEVFSKENILEALIIDENYQISFDDNVFKDFAYQLARKYNTICDERQFKTTKGDTITIGGGWYGWKINQSKEALQIANDVAGGAPVTREPIWEQTSYNELPGPNDIGDTYIELDITNQHMWYYKQGKLIMESDVVTGNMAQGNGTPDGVFYITFQKKDTYLEGNNGYEDYRVHVDYFMVFANNIGFHDYKWRKEFGGTLYKHSGSGGCVNMPTDSAKALWDELKNGTPVVSYYREPVTLTSTNCEKSWAYSYKKPSTSN